MTPTTDTAELCRNCAEPIIREGGSYCHAADGAVGCANLGPWDIAVPAPYPDPELLAFLAAEGERCEWCGKSVAGDAGADQGPGTAVLCYACRTLPAGVD